MSDMFSNRNVPWKDLGMNVDFAKNSEEAIKVAGVGWDVFKKEVTLSETGSVLKNFVAITRGGTNEVLSMPEVNKCHIVQNTEAFKFTDRMLSDGVSFDRAGESFDGKKVWLVMKLPSYYISSEKYIPYLVFTNTHDGIGAVRATVIPVRASSNSALNLNLEGASRSWTCNHRGDLQENLQEAYKTTGAVSKYMVKLEKVVEKLIDMDVPYAEAMKFTSYLLPINNGDPKRKIDHIKEMRSDIMTRWKEAPDLKDMPENAYRWLLAVADFAIHTEHHRESDDFKQNLFGKILSGNGLYIDKAYEILKKNV